MLVILDRQHSGQINRLTSIGAAADLDGNGEASIHEAEAFWTGYLSMSIELNLRQNDIHVIPISDGSYQERHSRVNDYAARYTGPVVYIALHLNAGGGDYGRCSTTIEAERGRTCQTISLKPWKQIFRNQNREEDTRKPSRLDQKRILHHQRGWATCRHLFRTAVH